MEDSRSVSLRTMVARVSPEDIVIYANGALASYLKVRKRELVGSPLDILARRAQGEIASCFARPEGGRSSNHLVTDSEGRVFEAKAYSDGGVLDIVLDEVTTAEAVGRELRTSSGTPLEVLSEEELRTIRHPERRYLTVSHTLLRGVTHVADRLAPMEARLMVNSFVEETSDAIFDVGCTVGETSGDSVLGIFGAPRYFADHPLRAIRAACDQQTKAASLHAGLSREGKELPPCSCGIWTGETLIGTLGNSSWQHYTALGAPVDLAKRLSQLARPGEILVPEHTFTHLLRVLPEGWDHLRAETENEPDLSDFQWTGDDIVPAPEHLRKIVYLIGPGVKQDTDRMEFYFDYLWAFRVPGRDQEIPILRVIRPSLISDSLELNSENVVTTQIAQTLGKYKLVEVLGVGGMGKVWRAVDRFGNSVAIKVLHSGEAGTEAQIKRFRREAEIMAKLPHRNICRVFEMNEFENIHYIAMEFVDGLSLADLLYEKSSSETSGRSTKPPDIKTLISSLRLEKSLREQTEKDLAERGEEVPSRPKKSRVLPVEQSLTLLLKVCEAVQFAHEHGVLHRDLKPGNILLREDGEPFVADFGLAKLSSPDATRSLSLSGHVVGTLENMAPEQAESSKDVDERADVYSIGTILYQMLTGRRHFEATSNFVADIQLLKTHEAARLRVHNPALDSDLEIITLKALRNDPAERYRSVAALQADIERYRRGEVISARPISWIEVTRKMVQRNKGVATVVLASVLIFFLGTLGAIGLLSRSLTKTRQALKERDDKNQIVQAKDAELEQKKRELEKAQMDLSDRAAAVELARKQAALVEETARAQKTMADKALAELRAAQEEAHQATQLALQDVEKERVAKEKAEEKIESLSRKAEQNAGIPPEHRPNFPHELLQAIQQSNQTLNLYLSRIALENPEMTGRKITELLTRSLEEVCAALRANRNFTPGWVAKARLHLALGEFDDAAESFGWAAHTAGLGDFPPPANEDLEALQDTAASLARQPGDKTKRAAEVLSRYQEPYTNIASILQALARDRKNSPDIRRPFGPNEATLALAGVNGEGVCASTGRDGKSLILWGVDNFDTLTPLKGKEIIRLAIVAAKTVDWKTLQSLPLESLDLSKCAMESFPAQPGSFPKLRSLVLAATPISSVDFARFLTLQSLDISDTRVTDLSPLRAIRLQHLNISGLNPTNLRVLANLPLRTLTLSPLRISDQAGLATLRFNRNMLIRAPDDPPDQTAAEFWRKLDTGSYGRSP